MSAYLVRQLEARPNIQTRFGCEVVGGGGEGRLDHLVLRDIASKTKSTFKNRKNRVRTQFSLILVTICICPGFY